MVVEICIAKVTYNLIQLTAGCEDETSAHFVYFVDNEHPVPYRIISCIDVCHWLSREHSYYGFFFILEGIEINKQLLVRNSLNALCYQSNCMNWVFSTELAYICLETGH